MRKIIFIIVLSLLMFSSNFTFANPDREDIEKAYIATFNIYFHSAMLVAFGKKIEGLTAVDKDTMVFNNLNISKLKLQKQSNYKTVSGKVVTINKKTVRADLILTGGPIKSLKWVIDEFSLTKKQLDVEIEGDGQKITYKQKIK